jgi:hypothetical protein
MSFDFARAFNPPKRLGSAIGLVNLGGFAGMLRTRRRCGVASICLRRRDRVDSWY